MSPAPKRLNESLIQVLTRLETIYRGKNHFKSRAYKKAAETIMTIGDDIIDVNVLKDAPNIGKSIFDKMVEYVQTGTIKLTDAEFELKSVNVVEWKGGPETVLADVYGIGPKKAKELVAAGITTIEQLRAKQDEVLNNVQRIGLRYYEDILQRIPRSEIERYSKLFKAVIQNINRRAANRGHTLHGEIVGSYRRGATDSGDIDVIFTCTNPQLYEQFIDDLIKRNIIIEVLSRGPSKCLVIGRIGEGAVARRVDFLFSSPEEFPFSILYFTGSKAFNTTMREHALKHGFTMNEHRIKLKTGENVTHQFTTEQDIFAFLGLKYVKPVDRIDGRQIIPL